MDLLLAQPDALPGLAACMRDSDATCWAEQLAAVSYGDPFFGACVCLSLLPCMPSEVQVSKQLVLELASGLKHMTISCPKEVAS